MSETALKTHYELCLSVWVTASEIVCQCLTKISRIHLSYIGDTAYSLAYATQWHKGFR